MHIRKACIEDALSILEWRNDETTRMNSFDHEIIAEENHIRWFKNKLSDKSCHFFILEDEEGPAGCVRVDVIKDVGEVSYMIAPGRRGKGYGTKCLSLMEEEFKKTDVKSLVGFVIGQNLASAKCFENNDYVKMSAGDVNCFIKNI
ncbi:L-amino acid N-acyltransferase YncA [Butyrivibrio fibrisolvens DSM 3071]|uniref:L-amino acid N-acyltransferase YncA n=1 Tax=Butyrivibrio fibrisolvens DSM 3071 TaxID=1121131 RepID=A0A1M5XU83_BUTFI|nr:GNAT family N-acetyltransferase [Butyrivibrio fibrisolvens]SHI03357.1 L-amino acid N-acyltransferase YncA [Butyrivibrio fibrisolvens DSM 3071]